MVHTAASENAYVDNYEVATEWTCSFSFKEWHVGADCNVTVLDRNGWLVLVCLPCRCVTQLEAISTKIKTPSSFAPRLVK